MKTEIADFRVAFEHRELTSEQKKARFDYRMKCALDEALAGYDALESVEVKVLPGDPRWEQAWPVVRHLVFSSQAYKIKAPKKRRKKETKQ